MVSLFRHFLLVTTFLIRNSAKGTPRAPKILMALAMILATLSVRTAFAQTFPLQIQVSVLPPYSAYLQDYPGAGQQVRVFLINTSRSTYQIRLSGQLTGDNGIEIRTSPNYRPPRPLTVPPGQTLLSRNDLEGLFDLNQIEVTGIDKNLLARGFPLPDGTYQLCVRAYNETPTNTAVTAFGQPLSAEFPLGCSAPIVVRSVEPPILISPLCDAEVTATTPQAVVFTWTPPAGVSPAQVDYTLRIVELPQTGVDPNVFIDAVALPRSGVEVQNLRTSTFLYGPTQPPLVVGKRYAWRVQAIDRSRKLNFLNDGKSPVCSFTYGTGLPVLAKKPGLELVQTPALPVLPIPGLDAQDTPPAGATAIADKIPAPSTPYELKIANCNCKIPPSSTEGSVADNQTVLTKKQLTVAGFTVDLAGIQLDAEQKINGTGTVQLPYAGGGYIKLRVSLSKVQCNPAGQVIAGKVRGLLQQNAGLLPGYDKPDFSALDLKPADVSEISKKLSAIKDQVKESITNSKNSIGWEMPLGVYTANVDVAITNVVFEPAQAYFDAVTWFKVASAQFGGVPLSATKVCMSPDKPICGDMTLYLGLDMPLSTLLTLKGATTDVNNKSANNLDFKKITNVNLNNWDFKTFHIVADLKPPGLKEANGINKDKELAVTLVYDSPKADLNDWTTTVEFPDFYVDKLSRDFIFSMDGKPGIYDQSELPDEYTAKLPDDYPQAGQKPGAEWKGLFFPKLNVTTTVLKSLNQGKPSTVSVENLICDDNGFTGAFMATPVISLGDGSLDGWYCSADTLKFNLLMSQFKNARLAGRVVMPIFKYTDEKQMEKSSIWPYTCTLSKDDKANGALTYQFLIVPPKEEAKVALWAAKLSVLDGTEIKVGNQGNKDGAFNASVTLNAKLSIDAKIVSPGMTIMGMKLQSSPADGTSYFTSGSINSSFASPQKALLAAADDEGFPVTIKSVSLDKVKGQASQYDFKFTGDITLMEGNIHAAITPYVRFKIGFGANKRPDWGLDKVGVDSVGIHGNLSFMRIDGTADFFDNEAPYGTGFKGDLNVKLLGAGFSVGGYFGRVNGFRYWQVGGKADLPAPVPIPGTPLTLAAFGGGAFHNMIKETQTDEKGKPKVGAPVKFTPSQKHDGFEVAVEVTMQTKDLFDMNGVMAATVSTENGFHLSDLRLDLNAALFGPEPDKALATGIGFIDVNFDKGYFDSKFGLNMHYQPGGGPFSVDGKGDLGLHVSFPSSLGNPDPKQDYSKEKPGNWYFFIGLPDATPCGNADDCFANSERIKLAIKVKSLGSLTFGSYFVMYHNLKPDGVTTLPPPPWGMSAADLEALGYKGVHLAGTDALAFGSGFVTDDKFEFGPFEAKFHAAFGFDLALQKITAPCSSGQIPGINGWYANGQMYADLALTLGINIDIWIYSGYLELLKVQAAALLEGGMVNPIWIHGSILLRYRALGGRIKGSTTFEMWYNKDEQCKPAFEQPNPFADLPIIAGMTPENNSKNVSVISPYYAEFSYPVRTLIQINDVDSLSRQPVASFRTFRLDFTSGTATNPFVTTQLQASSTNPNCSLDNSGRLRFGNDPDGGGNFNITFFRDATLPPNAKLSVSLTVGVKLLNTGTNQYDPYYYKKQLVAETKSYTFTTGECVSSLSQEGAVPSVAYSYPFEGQRYFTIGDGGIFGYVELSSNFGCCLDKIQSDKYYRLSVRYTALKGNKFDKKDPGSVWTNNSVKFDGKLLRFGIPINFLQKKTLYRIEIFREPTDALVAEQKKIIAQQKGKIRKELEDTYLGGEKAEYGFGNAVTVSSKPGPGPGTGLMSNKVASVNGLAQGYNAAYVDQTVQKENSQQGNAIGAKVTGQSVGTMADIKLGKGKSDEEVDVKTQLEQPVYTYFFQTSQYNTLAEKLKASPFLTAEQKTVRTSDIEAYTIPIQSPEGFDSYELLWKKLPNGSVLPPLVLQKVLDSTNPWFADFVKPMVSLINGLSNYQLGDGNILFKTADNTAAPTVNYDQLMRQVVLFNQGGFDNAQSPISKNSLKGITQN
ncbi:hypothetical protein GCM10028818_31780 [Spirosoma horti]